MRSLVVALNGTSENPWRKWGLTHNPFPQTAEWGEVGACLQLQRLGGDPIPNEDYIREHLKGFSQEFVDLCCKRFEKGKMVEFTVTWPEGT